MMKMSTLSKLSSAQGRKDEEPNKALGRELVENRDTSAIQEIAENLYNPDRRVQADCLEVLQQVGQLDPALIESYAPEFIQLLFSKHNRLVWAAMINLALIADRTAEEIFKHYDQIVEVIDKGTVITQDNGIKTLAKVAAAAPQYRQVILPYLLNQLKDCRAKSVPQYAESIRIAVINEGQQEYHQILADRLNELSSGGQKRVNKLLKT
jgi:hypothetical protein